MCETCVEQGRITGKILKALEDFEKKWPRSPYGPAHVVISDGNVNDSCIKWCLKNWNKYATKERSERAAEYAATKAFLRELLTWPIEEREP